jgi:purine-nucleoside phosphorylase
METINNTAQFLRDRGFIGALGVILGTGLGNLINEVEVEKEILYEDIPEFPVSTVASHHGKLIKGKIGGKTALIMQGRFHYYEGYSMREITFPVRVLYALGIKHLLVSNAAGAVNLDYQKGDLMLLDDHINFLPGNPLIGKNYDNLGPRFPDMSQPYDAELNRLMEESAKELKITLQKGVYLVQSGPTLETRAEYRMMRLWGADVVGMSTVPEVIVANHMSLPVAAVSVVTDIGDPDNLKPVSLEEILAVAGVAEKKLSALFKCVIEKIK